MAKIKTPKPYKDNISKKLDAYKEIGIFKFNFEGGRFFYFNSLRDYQGLNYPGYNELMAYGKSQFDIEAQEEYKDNQIIEKIQTILHVIKGFEQFEAQNDKRLFEERLKPLLHKNPRMYEQFIHIFDNPNEIDYIGYMTLLRIFEKDLNAIKENTNNLLNYMKEYNKNVSLARTELRKEINNDQRRQQEAEKIHELDSYNFLETYRGEINDKVQQQLNGIQSNYTNDFFAILNDYRNLTEGHGRTNSIYKADFSSLIQDMISTGTMEISGEELTSKLAKYNISAEQFDSIPLKLALIQKLRTLIRGSANIFGDLQNTLETELYHQQIALGEVKAAKRGSSYLKEAESTRYKEFFNYVIACLENLNMIEKQAETIDKIYNGGRTIKMRARTTEQLAGLTKDKRTRLLESLPDTVKNVLGTTTSPGIKEQLSKLESGKIWNAEQKKYIQAYEKFDIRRKEHFQKYISLIKEALNTTKTLPSLMKELNQLLRFSEANARKQTITITSETGAALDLHTIYSKTGELVSVALGSKGNRADSILIGHAIITTDDGKIDKEITAALDKTVNKIKKLNMDQFNKEARAYNKINNPEYATNVYSTKANLSASVAIEQSAMSTLTKELSTKDEEEALNYLKDIFVIEDSTKFATTFIVDEGGFKGGSLGSDIIMQIQNLNEMLEIGGIKPIDANFLLNAIMNAGPGMLGYSQKSKLEAYLSTIAAICMFQSGGLSLQQYAKTIVDNIKPLQYSTTKIHLFTLGTLHVPLSFILHLVCEGMEQCGNMLIQQIAQNRGSQVKIYNPVNEATDKISKEYTTSDNRTFKIGDWYATAAAGLPKVKLDMTIMGGYLDILEEIQQKMNSII